MKPGPAIAQQLGPMGINIGKVITKVNEVTKSFKGMKVPVELDVNEKTKDFTVHTYSPPTSELLKKELNLEKGSDKISMTKVGNASIEDVIKIAKIKHSNMLEKDLKNAVKSVLGTCASVGILIENKESKEIIIDIEEGKFDKEIREEKTETDKEKRQVLNEYFQEVKAAQEAKAIAVAPKPEEAEKTEEDKTQTSGKTDQKTVQAKTTAKSPTKQTAKPTEKTIAKKGKK